MPTTSFEAYITKLLIESGMFESQASEVITAAKNHELLADFKDRWGHEVSGYPEIMGGMIWSRVKDIALQWIDENIPEAWYRDMFVA